MLLLEITLCGNPPDKRNELNSLLNLDCSFKSNFQDFNSIFLAFKNSIKLKGVKLRFRDLPVKNQQAG